MRILILLSIVLVTACNPFTTKELRKKNRCNKKLERLTEKCPLLLQADTIIDTVTIKVPEIRIDTFVQVNEDVSGVDSIIATFEHEMDSITASKIRTQIKWYVKERPCLIDTISFDSMGVQVKIYQVGDKIKFSFYKPEEEISTVTETVVDVVKPIELSVWDQIRLMLGKMWWWLIIIVVIVVAYKILKKSMFPWLP